MPLISDGKYAPFSGVLPLISLAPNTASVYNNVNLLMQRDLQTSGELLLYTSGNNMFGDTPISFVDDPDAVKDLETNIANINNVAFLVARGGFRNG